MKVKTRFKETYRVTAKLAEEDKLKKQKQLLRSNKCHEFKKTSSVNAKSADYG